MAAVLVAIAVSTPAAAGEFCDDLGELTADAADGFSQVELTQGLLGATGGCALSMGTGAIRRVTCRWGFDYRAPAAATQRAALEQQITACLPGLTAIDQPGVNHPDTFDQRSFDGNAFQITLSLKDKVALDQTFIFLGIAPAP